MSDAATERAMSEKTPGVGGDIDIREQATNNALIIREVNEENTATSVTTDDGNKPRFEPQDNSGAPSAVGFEKGDELETLWVGGKRIAEEGVTNKASCGGDDSIGVGGGEDMYRHLSQFAVSAINEARCNRQQIPLILDSTLAVPAMTHCTAMCEHNFLSHWDIGGRKPYQRYADFAYGQHVSEVVFGSDVEESNENQIKDKIKDWIDGRAGSEAIDDGGNNANHLLNSAHTHIAIGICASNGQLRYVEVYADRYLELLDAPVELSLLESDDSSGFQVSVQMSKVGIGPYACLVFHDPVATPLTMGELQQQFRGPYSDFTTNQVAVVWPWQMEQLMDGVFDIPVLVFPIEAGTYYLQILVRGDPESIPYDTYPPEGLPLPGESFCGAALVIKAPEATSGARLGVSDLDEDGELLMGTGVGTLEEREARLMASTMAMRRDLAPIVKIRVVQETGSNIKQRDNYETTVFMPPERAEDVAQANLAIAFRRLGSWNDSLSRGRNSFDDCDGSIGNESQMIKEIRAASTEKDEMTEEEIAAERTLSEAPADITARNFNGKGNAEVGDPIDTSGGEPRDSLGDEQAKDKRGEAPKCGEVEGSGEATGEEGEQGKVSSEGGTLDKGGMMVPPQVVTEITVVTFRQGQKVEAPEGYQLLPGDLADSSGSDGDCGSEELLLLEEGQDGEGETGRRFERGAGALANPEEEEKGERGREAVFLCVKVAPYTDRVSPLTDLVLVYGTETFEMGFGFATLTLPQVVNELYGSTMHLCYKKAGASLAVIQQVAERTAEKTAKQIQQHLGIEEHDTDDCNDDSTRDGEARGEIDRKMTPEQMLEWEDRKNREAAERADKREQAEKERRRQEERDAIRRRIEEALKEKGDLMKENGDWQKKISVLMLSQQKARDEARAEHGGRGLEKETTPAHESEKQYAEALASIVSCREKLKKRQAKYDTVAIGLQTRLDEKEYKSREIADSFKEFKREIARTAEHSRMGKTIPKHVIGQFEAAEAKKDEEIEKVRLKNINLRMMLRKTEGKLRAKEQLAEGLHLIDFEQLKIENQTISEKIEERNEELLKLRKKNTTMVQILTHIKEKLQFVAGENEVTSHKFSALEEELSQERDCLTRAKKERDALRMEVAGLRQSQGLANSDLLIRDFENRKLHIKNLGEQLEELRSNRRLLLLQQERLRERTGQPTYELGGHS